LLPLLSHLRSIRNMSSPAFQTILSEVSSHLRNQIVLQSNQDAISRIKFFSCQDEGVIASLITAMKPMFQMGGELLCTQGHVGKEMYFILKGAVEATVVDLRESKPTLLGLYLQGHYCGDVSLVLSVRRPMTLRAVTHCDIFALAKVCLYCGAGTVAVCLVLAQSSS